MKESCAYCGEMTKMMLKGGRWVSGECEHCQEDLSKIDVPELVDEKPKLKANAEDLP